MRTNPWIVDIILVLWDADRRTGTTKGVLDWNVRLLRHRAGLKLPKAFAETTQSYINHHTSQSMVWVKNGSRPDDDILYSPMGERSGTWAIKDRKRALLKVLTSLRITQEEFDALMAEISKKLGKKS
jgi:hypothetical protein